MEHPNEEGFCNILTKPYFLVLFDVKTLTRTCEHAPDKKNGCDSKVHGSVTMVSKKPRDDPMKDISYIYLHYPCLEPSVDLFKIFT